MSDISFWEAMKRVARLSPRWKYTPRSFGQGNLYFETTTPDGAISVLIEKGYQYSLQSSSPIGEKDGFRLTITCNGCVIYRIHCNVVYKSSCWGGSPKPHYSREYIYLKECFEPFEARGQANREEKARKGGRKKRDEELKIQRERNKFLGR